MGPATERVKPGDGRVGSASSALRAVLAECCLDDTEGVPHAALVRVFQDLGYTAESARQALSRAVRQGALAGPPDVRRGQVLLSEAGREALRMAATETNRSADPVPWDHTWSLLIMRGVATLSSPHRVRNALLTEGLGQLGNGVWITPHSDKSERLVRMLESDPALHLIVCRTTFDHPSEQEIVGQAWDLEKLRAGYERFLAIVEGLSADTDAEAFVAWIMTVGEWQRLTRLDPGIPAEAIGSGWPAQGARTLLATRRAEWAATATQYFQRVVTDFPK